MNEDLRVLLVDRHEMVAECLAAILGEEQGLRIVGVAHRVEHARDLVLSQCVDVLVIDPQLPDGSGLDLVVNVRRLRPRLAVVVTTGDHRPATLAMALDAGCAGYVPKSSRVSALISAVRRAAAGEVAVANPYLEELADHLAHARRHPRQRLTAREHEVLELLAAGLSTEEISHRLIVSSHTVRNHIRAILRKIGAHTRLEAVSLARHSGLLADE